MTRILHRDTRMTLPQAVGGEGIHIIDSSGKRYIDASGGAAVSCLGHGHPDVTRAMKAQADQLAYAHTSFFTTAVAEELADTLVGGAPAELSHVYFVSGGSEAVEAALKMARQYFVEKGEPQRRHFIARSQSYHGNTLGALAVGGNEWRRRQFAPLLIDVPLIEPCFAYRWKRAEESEDQYGRRAADALEAEILRLGPGTVAAFIAETVVGATTGAVAPAPGYFRRIREICDRHGVLLILDEVMCGMGRTGTMHACEQEGVAPDLLIVAKGLGGGYQPIGAVLVAGKIQAAIASGSGALMHGQTYMGHPVACAAGVAVVETIRAERLLDNVRAMGTRLMDGLVERFGNHHHVGDVRGRGLLQAIELVADRATKRPFDPALKLNGRVKAEAMALGLMVYPMAGTLDGRQGDHIVLAPPYIVKPEEIDVIVERLGAAVDAALATLPAAA